MQELTIMIVAKAGEEKCATECVESIREYSDIETVNVVLVNNGGDTSLNEWSAENAQDVAFVDMEGYHPYGEAVNMVKEALNINTDLMLLDPILKITPHALGNLLEQFEDDPKTGAVAGSGNKFYGYYQSCGFFTSYEDAVANVEGRLKDAPRGRIISLVDGAVIYRKEVMDLLGEFDGRMNNEVAVVRDYCLRMLDKGYYSAYTGKAFFWTDHEKKAVGVNEDLETLGNKFGMHYFVMFPNGSVVDCVKESPDKELNVLEVGCDCGANLVEIGNRYPNAKLYGAEINPASAKIAGYFADVIVANIEEQDLPYEEGMFDYIVFGDVLEHLRDPLATVRYCKKLLKKGGVMVSSIPNVMHVSVMDCLLNGDFTYQDAGLLDRTHIHLFTAREVIRMYNAAELKIESMTTVVLPITDEQHKLIDKLMEISGPGVDRAMYEAFQILSIVRKE